MAHTNTTTNYSLPQFIATDKPAWLTDFNGAMSDIDGQMKLNADAASTAGSTATAAASAATAASTAASNAASFKAGDTFYINGYFPFSSSSNGKTLTGSIMLPKDAAGLSVSVQSSSVTWVSCNGTNLTSGLTVNSVTIGGGSALNVQISSTTSVGAYEAAMARFSMTVEFSV